MTRKIKYKPVSKELENIVKPIENASSRVSVGLDKAVGEYYFIDVKKLNPYKNQARKVFNEDQIQELANSIREYGIRQPLTVLRGENGEYAVISGERRLRAAKEISMERVPCIILQEHRNADAIALIENIHRQDLHPIELGESYKQLLNQEGFQSQEALSKAISVTKSTISEYIKLAKLPEYIKNQIIEKGITAREKLRNIVKAYAAEDKDKLHNLVGLSEREQKNFSIIRILSSEGQLKVQKVGMKKLSPEGIQQVKSELLGIIQEIESINK